MQSTPAASKATRAMEEAIAAWADGLYKGLGVGVAGDVTVRFYRGGCTD